MRSRDMDMDPCPKWYIRQEYDRLRHLGEEVPDGHGTTAPAARTDRGGAPSGRAGGAFTHGAGAAGGTGEGGAGGAAGGGGRRYGRALPPEPGHGLSLV